MNYVELCFKFYVYNTTEYMFSVLVSISEMYSLNLSELRHCERLVALLVNVWELRHWRTCWS
jgi:hypothetical protein